MELDQLRYFLAVARSNNMSHAAQELRISQSSLSRVIIKLEKELKVQLFDRNPRSLPLTEAGVKLRRHAEQIIDMVDSTAAILTDDGKSGTIRLGAIPTIAPYFLPGFLKKFSTEFPNSKIQLSEEVTSRLLDRLTHGELDLAVMALPVDSKYLETVTLFKEDLYLLTTIKHPLYEEHTTGDSMDLGKLAKYPFIMLDQEHCLSDQITSFCQKKSFQPILMERASQLTTIQQLVSLGHGISVVPDMARQYDHDHLRYYIRLKNPQPTRTIVMVYNSYRYQTKLLQSCIKLLKKYSEKWLKS